MASELYRIDNVLWDIYTQPHCPKHKLEMDAWTMNKNLKDPKYDHLFCEECDDYFPIPRDIDDEKKFIKRKIKALGLKDVKILNIDGESIYIAEDKVKSNDGKYFVKAILTESKSRKRLVIYAGETSENDKKKRAQMFVEIDSKKLSFDQNDLHPLEVFTKVEATFKGNVKASLVKTKK